MRRARGFAILSLLACLAAPAWAAERSGVWNTTSTHQDIFIPPTFWQSRFFLALCALALLAASWLIYRVRLQAIAARIRSGLNERLAERERIARELQDTLLQGVQGLILRFQLIAEDLPKDQPQRATMEEALDTADNLLGEARSRVQDLRATDLSGDLEPMLATLVERRRGAGLAPIGIFVEGRPRPLERIAGDELLLIVDEALANAQRHADATCIEIQVRFAFTRLGVAVVDDGKGIEPDILRRGGRPGHFGLAGMQERAHRLKGRIRLGSGPGCGTRVSISIPAHTAYEPGAPWFGPAKFLGRFAHG